MMKIPVVKIHQFLTHLPVIPEAHRGISIQADGKFFYGLHSVLNINN